MPCSESITKIPRSTRLSWWSWPGWIVILVLIGMIRLYQWTISPLIGSWCRFQPTCSQYMIEALKKYGLWRGMWKGTRRVLRCHPWNPGGYDPP